MLTEAEDSMNCQMREGIPPCDIFAKFLIYHRFTCQKECLFEI